MSGCPFRAVSKWAAPPPPSVCHCSQWCSMLASGRVPASATRPPTTDVAAVCLLFFLILISKKHFSSSQSVPHADTFKSTCSCETLPLNHPFVLRRRGSASGGMQDNKDKSPWG